MPANMKISLKHIKATIERHLGVILMFNLLIFGINIQAQNSMQLKTVVLDAGHGGKDPGNTGTKRYKTTEKDITLDVTLLLGNYIAENFPDVNIVYTRTDDSYPTLNERVELANDVQADLFISIHCDAFTKSTAKGSGTFVMGMHKTKESLRVAMNENASIYKEENYEENYSFDPTDPDTYLILSRRQNVFLDNSLNFSNYVQKQFKDRVGRIDRGVKQAGFYVISYTSMPSALIELGFLTNPDEEDFLNTQTGKEYMASAIFRAFRDYKSDIEKIGNLIGEDPIVEEPIEEIKAQENPKEVIVDESERPYTDLNKAIVHQKTRGGVKFQVQIMSSSKRLKKGDPEFKGIKKSDEYESNGLFKYAVGCTSEYEEAKKMQLVLRENGFDGAFVIAFKDNERIQLHEAISANK